MTSPHQTHRIRSCARINIVMTCSDTSTFPPFSFRFHLFPAIQTDISPTNHDPSTPTPTPTPTPKSPDPRNHSRRNGNSKRRQDAVAEGGAGGGETGATEQAEGQLLLDL